MQEGCNTADDPVDRRVLKSSDRDDLPTLSQPQIEWLDGRVREKQYVHFIASEYRRTESVSQLAAVHKMVVDQGKQMVSTSTADMHGLEILPLDEREFDFFINHAQSTGGDQAKTLFLLLEAAGCKVWYDMHAAEIVSSQATAAVACG